MSCTRAFDDRAVEAVDDRGLMDFPETSHIRVLTKWGLLYESVDTHWKSVQQHIKHEVCYAILRLSTTT